MKKKVSDWFAFFAPRYIALLLTVGVVLRIFLICMPVTETNFSLLQYFRIFFLGALNDLAFSAIALVPAFVVYSFTARVKYSRPWCWIILGILAVLTFYVICFNDITDEYGSAVPMIANILLAVLLLSYSAKLFVPCLRDKWRKCFLFAVMGVYAVFVVLFNLIGEPIFWDEFGVRYNFIAVDYLVYTNEVVGNIVESYPMVPIVIGVLAGAVLICWLMTRRSDLSEAGVGSGRQWLLTLAIVAATSVGGGFFLHWSYNTLSAQDMFVTQLQENGHWDFLEAYSSSELDYEQFYAMIDKDEARSMQKSLCNQDGNGVQKISTGVEFCRKNIVLVTIESLSADFMERYGNGNGITPNLDRIMDLSLSFDNLFATGNRTVRGLEALTLCIPPSSGESLVKRPDNADLYSTAKLLRAEGYSTTFIYGGDSYFDNMKAFFGGNGYDIHDKNSYDKSAIVFDNIWGTCDEDSYREALALFDSKSASGQPFFAHIMTISNHRPYTYPEGRIEYDGEAMSRSAAVKYTDYAIGAFLKEAESHEWFSNTVFLIVADHCASSAGKTSLPLEGYHIPGMIYAPGFVEPQRVEKLCSQIDLMPTLFSILGMSYDSQFYGQNILEEDFHERALMATYQDLGYYTDGILTVLSPVRRIRQYDVTDDGSWHYVEKLIDSQSERALAVCREAQAIYQAGVVE